MSYGDYILREIYWHNLSKASRIIRSAPHLAQLFFSFCDNPITLLKHGRMYV